MNNFTDLDLFNFFNLSQDSIFFNQAITPKSCGGGPEFKNLALLGDKILDFMMVVIYREKEILDTGKFTKDKEKIHQKDVLANLAKKFNIGSYMQPIDVNYLPSDNDLKESIEALIGACYLTNGIESCKHVIQKILDIIKEKNIPQFINYIGILQEILAKAGDEHPKYDSNRIGGEDHLPLWQCRISGSFDGEPFENLSEEFNQIPLAEQDAAKKVLSTFGLTDDISLKNRVVISESNQRVTASQSIYDREIIFSKGDKKTASKSGVIQASSETGEILVDWVIRKAKKNPFGMLLLLSGRIENISGSSWNTEIKTPKQTLQLVLLTLELNGVHFFELSANTSKSQARKAVARKIIENSQLYAFLEENYPDETI